MIGVETEIKVNGGCIIVEARVVGDEEAMAKELQRFLSRRLEWGFAEGVFYIMKRLSDFDTPKDLEEWVWEKCKEVVDEFKKFNDVVKKAKKLEG